MSNVGSVSRAGSKLIRALPWCVVGGALATLPPIFSLDALILAAHLPTFVVLLAWAVTLAGRVRRGQVVSLIAVAGFLGGLGASVALMGFMTIGTLEDGTSAIFYFITWMLLPIFAVVGSGLGAALVAFGRFVFRRRSKSVSTFGERALR